MFKPLSGIALAAVTLQAQSVSIPSELVGVWSSSEVRSIMFSDRSNTAFSRPSGATIKYEINADGSYREDTLIQTSMYNCTDTVFAEETGQVHVDGSKLVFEAGGGTLRSTDNCNARFKTPFRAPEYSRCVTPGGLVVVSLALERDGNEHHAVVTVKDTGAGISPEDFSHIFDRFYRASKDRSRATGGAGLGLAIAQCIVGRHDGLIQVQSQLGHGATFRVILPSPSQMPASFTNSSESQSILKANS